MIKDNLQIYEVNIDPEYSDGEDLGIDLISNVVSPAVKIKGHAFSNDEHKKYCFADKLKYRIGAPALVPMDIYRNDDEEYYLRFTETKIEQLAKKFMKNLTKKGTGVFNLEHTSEMVDSFILEAYLCDNDAKVKMIKESFGVSVPKGTFFLVQQFNDKAKFEEIVAKGATAFSIEGFLGMEVVDYFEKNKQIKQSNIEMKIQLYSSSEKMNFTIIDGISKWEINADNTTFNLEEKVTYTVDDVTYSLTSGEYELADGTRLLIDADGIIKLITPPTIKGEFTNNNKTNNNLKMENENLMLPEGAKFQIGDKWYEVKDGVIIESIVEADMVTETVVDETAMVDEVVDTPVADEVVEVIEPVVAPETTDIDAKFDEIYQMIANLKTEISTIKESEVDEVPVAMKKNFTAALASYLEFQKNAE